MENRQHNIKQKIKLNGRIIFKRGNLITNQAGFSHNSLMVIVIFVIAIFGVYRLVANHVSADSPKITSGVSGQCLNDRNDGAGKTTVDSWGCNDTTAQVWVVNGTAITHESNDCLTVANNSTSSGATVILSSCDGGSGQVWLRDKGGYYNPNSTMCLSASATDPSGSLFISSCSGLSSSQEIWSPSPDGETNICTGTQGQKVACSAEKEWISWQSGTISHEALLNTYTDGAPYEEWCADFVSYVYKEAGYPFTGGEANGWDENIASNIQNMGFSEHSAASGYVPKAGDVAYFNYSGGHVEIVISGGKTPTFIYGNSATIDPSTGNGEMMANTIMSDGNQGQVVYYLSPN